MGADARDQVLVDGEPVAVRGVRSHGGRRNVFNPVGEPLLHGPGPSGGAHVALVAELLQVPDCPDYIRFLLAFDVAPVWGSVVFGAHSDSAVPPLVVLAVIDCGRPVRRACARFAFLGIRLSAFSRVLLGDQPGGVGSQGLDRDATEAADSN